MAIERIRENFAQRLSELLKKQGMSQKELAERVGITEASMSRYMNTNRIPKSEILANIATALNTTSDYLLGVEEEGNIDLDYPRIVRLIARNSSSMTTEQKRAIINELLGN
jgi:transcriptional regulator with XRE-family HTH domain